jgi:hypothetical protein
MKSVLFKKPEFTDVELQIGYEQLWDEYVQSCMLLMIMQHQKVKDFLISCERGKKNLCWIYSVVKEFYSRLQNIHSNNLRSVFEEKSSKIFATDLTHNDLLIGISRLIYRNNTCVVLSFFQGKVLLASNTAFILQQDKI